MSFQHKDFGLSSDEELDHEGNFYDDSAVDITRNIDFSDPFEDVGLKNSSPMDPAEQKLPDAQKKRKVCMKELNSEGAKKNSKELKKQSAVECAQPKKRGGRKSGAVEWSEQEKNSLLFCVKAHFNVLKQVSKKKQIWNTIAADMEAMGYKRDGPACASKYRSLVSQYKICKDLNKRSGNAKITYQQMGTIDEMLGENESTEPEFLFSLGVQTSVDKNVLLSESEKNNLSAPKTSAPKETLAAKKRAVVDEDSAHPEAPFVQGP